jgi:hypothetical protein
MNLIRSIINFFGFNDAIVDGIGERGMRDSSIIRYNEVHDMYDKIIKDLGIYQLTYPRTISMIK